MRYILSYLYIHLGIGFLVTLVFYCAYKYQSLKFGDPIALSNALNIKRQFFYYRIFSDYLIPTLAGVLMICVWPVVLYMIIKKSSVLDEIEELKPIEDVAFKVALADLLEKMSESQVESKEMVRDPNKGHTGVPFGHFNKYWVEFRGHLGPEDEIWSFKSEVADKWDRCEIKTGYVCVKNNESYSYILTSVIRKIKLSNF